MLMRVFLETSRRELAENISFNFLAPPLRSREHNPRESIALLSFYGTV